jgi:hypothetical protein
LLPSLIGLLRRKRQNERLLPTSYFMLKKPTRTLQAMRRSQQSEIAPAR